MLKNKFRFKVLSILMASFLGCFGLAGLAHAGTDAQESESSIKSVDEYRSEFGEDYVIGVGDVILISVWRNDDLSISVPVRPDGKVSAPLIGDFQAAGLTPTLLSKSVKTKLSQFVRDPQVSVVVTGLSSHEFVSRVRIVGAVRSPQTVPFRKGMTVIDLLLSAGGTNDFASGNKAILYRKSGNEEQEQIKLRLKDLVKKGKLEYNFKLQPGDIISVPQRLF